MLTSAYTGVPANTQSDVQGSSQQNVFNRELMWVSRVCLANADIHIPQRDDDDIHGVENRRRLLEITVGRPPTPFPPLPPLPYSLLSLAFFSSLSLLFPPIHPLPFLPLPVPFPFLLSFFPGLGFRPPNDFSCILTLKLCHFCHLHNDTFVTVQLGRINPIQSNEYNGSRPRPLFPSLSKI